MQLNLNPFDHQFNGETRMSLVKNESCLFLIWLFSIEYLRLPIGCFVVVVKWWKGRNTIWIRPAML